MRMSLNFFVINSNGILGWGVVLEGKEHRLWDQAVVVQIPDLLFYLLSVGPYFSQLSSSTEWVDS